MRDLGMEESTERPAEGLAAIATACDRGGKASQFAETAEPLSCFLDFSFL